MLLLRKILSICIGLSCLTALAQQSKTDSLRSVLKTAKEDTNKVNTLNSLSKQLWQARNLDTALICATSAQQLAIDLRFRKGEANAYTNMSLVHYELGNYQNALNNIFSAIKIQEQSGDKKGLASSYNNVGEMYRSLGNYNEALKNHLAALKIKEEAGDKKSIAITYNNIGNTYSNMNNFTEALKNHQHALKIKEETGADKNALAISYNNIGSTYSLLYNLPEALKYFQIALKLREGTGNQKGIASCYNNIGLNYYSQKNYAKSLENYTNALEIQEKLNDKQGQAALYGNLGNLYVSMGKAKEGRELIRKGIVIAAQIGSKEIISANYIALSHADSSLNDFKEAFNSFKMHVSYRDSLLNEENTKKVVQQQMLYDFDKKQTADSLQVEEERKLNTIKFQEEKKQRYYLYGGLALVIVFAGFIFNRFRLTQKQKQIIEIKERETQQQKQLLEEKNKEITDSITYAKRLQEAILPPKEYINQFIPDNFVLYKPKDIVAGDFYWAEHIGNLFFIAAADSTGHGVPGAMVSVVCSNALNRAVKEFGLRDTGKILDKTRELVLETFAKSSSEVKDGMDISLLCLDTKNKKIYWSGANNPLWYISKNSASDVMLLNEIKADKQPIGKTEKPAPFTTHEISYLQNTTFYLFTDGYPDQFGGPKGKKFKYKQLKELLFVNHTLSLQEQSQILDQQFTYWKGSLEQVDDLTIIGIKV